MRRKEDRYWKQGIGRAAAAAAVLVMASAGLAGAQEVAVPVVAADPAEQAAQPPAAAVIQEEKKLAELQTYPGATETPAVVRLKNRDDVIVLYCRPKIMTTVRLPGNELVKEFFTGDDEAMWQCGGADTPYFAVKPFPSATVTTALVRTSANNFYHFKMTNLDNREDVFLENGQAVRQRFATPQVRAYESVIIELVGSALNWQQNTAAVLPSGTAPAQAPQVLPSASVAVEQQLAAAQAQMDEQYHQEIAEFVAGYSTKIDPNYKVKNREDKRYGVGSVYNDGTFTWVQLRGEKLLHVFEENENGQREMVNFKIIGDFYRVDRVCPELRFADGDKGDWIIAVARTES